MSFCTDAKESLCTSYPKQSCCRQALLYGYLYAGPEFTDAHITLRFENEKIGTYISHLCSEFYSFDLKTDKGRQSLEEDTASFLFRSLDQQGSGISGIVYTCEKCSQSFLKGVFLCCASAADPAKEYHVEFAGMTEERADELAAFLALQGIPIRKSHRRGKPVLYYKSAQLIERFFSYIGAGKALFGVLNAKLIGEARNSINRLGNFENANLNRTVAASSELTAAIKKLCEAGKINHLPEQLRESAELRLRYPNANLTALAAMHKTPISKSGLTHRMRKIMEIANEEE